MIRVVAVIPALDEERALPAVLAALPRDVIDRVVVVDNGSTDRTADVARVAGCVVVREERRGYGQACLTGVRAAEALAPDVLLFLDADGSDDPADIPRVLAPILAGEADLVVGSRTTGTRERGALTPQARVGNLVATRLLRLFWGARFTDLGPLRAIRAEALRSLRMRDRGFGWTVEMQIKAARRRLRCVEMPVRYRRRVGRSKISGTLTGSVRAGAGILGTIARESVRSRSGA